MKCIMCKKEYFNKPLFSIQDRLRIFDNEYKVYQCEDCKTLMIDPFPTSYELEKLYPSDYNFKIIPNKKDKNNIIKNLEWLLFYKRLYVHSYNLISKTISQKQFKIFDIGCGNALRLKVFKDFGCQVSGNEISQSCVDYAKDYLGITIYKGTFGEIVSRLKEKYDVVTMFALLEHLTEPEKIVSELYPILKENGWLIIKIPVIDTIQYSILGKKTFMIKEMPRHIFVPSIKALEKFMLKLGFKLEKYEPVSIFESAALFSLGMFDNSSYCVAYRSSFIARFIGWIFTIFPGVFIGTIESMRGVSTEVIFFFRKIDDVGHK